MTFIFNRVRAVVKLHVHAKYHQAKCSGSWVIVRTSFFAMSRNGEQSENPVLWPWPLTYDLNTLWVSSVQDVPAKFHLAACSGSMSYRASREQEIW